MHKLTTENMAKAIERAKAERLKVKVVSVSQRRYSVTNSSGVTYNVRFAVANGHRLGACDCAARTVCKHLAAAAAVNVALHSDYSRESAPADKLSTGQLIIETAKYYPYGHGYLV
jgi:uncharacterized Zn finger protein